MRASEQLRKALRRGAYGIAVLILMLAPAHLAVPCKHGDWLLALTGTLFLTAVALTIVGTRTAKHRFRPIFFAICALVAHTIFLHG